MYILGNVARIVSYYFDFQDAVDSAQNVSSEETLSGKIVRICDTAARAVSFGCRTVCCVGRMSGTSLQTLQSVKQVEKAARVCELGTTLMTVSEDSRRMAACLECRGPFFRIVNIFESVAKPVASLARVNAELNAYQAQIDQEAHSKNEDPLSPNMVAMGEKVARCTSSGHTRAVGETLLQVNALSTLALLHEIAREHERQCILSEAHSSQEEPDPTDLLSLSYIPASLHEDPVFKQHICPITLMPIRHPVRDPHNETYYERSAIERVLESDPRSPLTRLPLRKEDLLPQEELQRTIDDRLRMYQTMLQERITSFIRT